MTHNQCHGITRQGCRCLHPSPGRSVLCWQHQERKLVIGLSVPIGTPIDVVTGTPVQRKTLLQKIFKCLN